MKVRKAVIPAAGLGTRFLPATKAQPKEMLPLVDKPSIQYVIEEAVGAGIEDILIVTGRGKQAIEDHFDRSVELEQLLTDKGDEDKLELVRHISDMAQVHYIRQKAPLGLGHAVSMAEQHVGDEPFAVLLGDDVIDEGEKLLSDLITSFERHGSSVLAAMEVEQVFGRREVKTHRRLMQEELGESLGHLRMAAAHCHGCDLWARATQTVFGRGRRRRR